MRPTVDTTVFQDFEVPMLESQLIAKILHSSLNGIYVYDLKAGMNVFINAEYTRLTGYTLERLNALRGHEFLALFHPQDREHVIAHWAAFGEAGDDDVLEIEYRFRRADGEWIWCLSRDSVLERESDGSIRRLVGTFLDITKRKQVGPGLRESGERLQLAKAAARLGIYDYDVLNDTIQWDKEVRRLWGARPETAITYEVFLSGLHPNDRASTEAAVNKAFKSAGDGRYYAEYRVISRADGVARWVAATGQAFFEQGRAVRLVGIVQDITELKRAEEALQEAARRKNAFLATLAHELRNPLAPIRNAVDILKLQSAPDPTLQAARDMIDRQLRYLVRLIDDLSDVSRITRGKLKLRRQQVTLTAVLERALEVVRPNVERAGHTLIVSLPGEPIDLDADPVRLTQVFLNLLNNACKYTKEQGRIGLIAERDQAQVVIKVTDTGMGIAPEHLTHVFELFSQVDSSLERSQGGLGIGLSLAQGVVEMHGGHIQAHSEGLGKGSEFIVRLPILCRRPAPQPSPRAHRDVSKAAMARRILVVDDNRDITESLALLLRLNGHEVATAHDGLEAVEIAARYRPEVMLLDIGMPKLDGYAACRRIRDKPWGKHIVIVAVTGWGHEKDRRESKAAGFDDHWVKPVKPATLLKRLAELQAVEA